MIIAILTFDGLKEVDSIIAASRLDSRDTVEIGAITAAFS
jgi:hypothetical protein